MAQAEELRRRLEIAEEKARRDAEEKADKDREVVPRPFPFTPIHVHRNPPVPSQGEGDEGRLEK